MAIALHRLQRRYDRIKDYRAGLYWSRLPPLVPAVDLIVDVGAGHGTPDLYAAFPTAPFILIDAVEENRKPLEAFAETYQSDVMIAAAGAAHEVKTIRIAGTGNGSRSSFHTRVGKFSDDQVQLREVAVERLDVLLLPWRKKRIGLKLDVEGHEMAVLKGAVGLESVQWIVAEVSTRPRFVDDPLFAGIYTHLADRFDFLEILDIRRHGGGILRYFDAVFVRRA